MWETDDGVEITPGLRVFTNDWEWGTVLPEQFTRGGSCDPGGKYFDGWFRVALDTNPGDTRGGLYNGERMSASGPPEKPDPIAARALSSD